MDAFPKDVLALVFAGFALPDLMRVRRVCRLWNATCIERHLLSRALSVKTPWAQFSHLLKPRTIELTATLNGLTWVTGFKTECRERSELTLGFKGVEKGSVCGD